MFRAAKKDVNHNEIADIFKKNGWSVLDVSQLKKCCDMFIAKRGRTIAVEVKDGAKPPSARKLTDGELIFARNWNGEYRVITTEQEALDLIT